MVDCAAEALIKDRAEAIAKRAAQHDGAVLPQGGNILKDMLRGMHASSGWPPYQTLLLVRVDHPAHMKLLHGLLWFHCPARTSTSVMALQYICLLFAMLEDCCK